MKKAPDKKKTKEIRKEHDFSGGVRGKYAQRYAEGSNVIMLPPDLAMAFPTAEAVHEALRGLVSLAKKTANSKPAKRRSKPPG